LVKGQRKRDKNTKTIFKGKRLEVKTGGQWELHNEKQTERSVVSNSKRKDKNRQL